MIASVAGERVQQRSRERVPRSIVFGMAWCPACEDGHAAESIESGANGRQGETALRAATHRLADPLPWADPDVCRNRFGAALVSGSMNHTTLRVGIAPTPGIAACNHDASELGYGLLALVRAGEATPEDGNESRILFAAHRSEACS